MMSEKKGCVSRIKTNTGINVNRCYQCGKCSAGCVLNEDMEYPPSTVMRMLQTNREENYDTLLRSQTIWMCVSCQNCFSRCPMQIDIPKLMDFMREESIRKNRTNKQAKDIISFHRSFLDSVKYTGRLFEIGLVAGYKFRTMHLWQDLNVAPKMFLKGKLPVLPEIVKDKKQLSILFSETEQLPENNKE